MEILYTILFMLGWMILGYLCGSIPNGVLIGRMHGINIRDYGSHNTGGTNVGRTLGKKAGIMTMILDGLKCFLPMLFALLFLVYSPIKTYLIEYKYLNELTVSLVAFFVFIGHTFPLFNHFQGGKCVASFGGYIFWYWEAYSSERRPSMNTEDVRLSSRDLRIRGSGYLIRGNGRH